MIYPERFSMFVMASIDNEGGLVTGAKAKIIKDAGGATNYGISLRFLRKIGLQDGDINKDGIIDEKDILILDYDGVKKLYYKYFWNNYYGDLASLEIAFRIFDFGIMSGPGFAVKLAQRRLNSYVNQKLLIEDGVFGTKTLLALNGLHPVFKKNFGELIAEDYVLAYKIYLKELNKPQFIKGWLNRLSRPFKYFIDKFKKA